MSRLVFLAVLLSCYVLDGTAQWPGPAYSLDFEYVIDCISVESKLSLYDISLVQTFTPASNIEPDESRPCAALLTAEYINARAIQSDGWSSRKGPANFYPLGVPIRDCCGTNLCTGCFSPIKGCVFRISTGRGETKIIAIEGRCSFCQQYDCPYTCPNGTVKPFQRLRLCHF